MSVEDTLAERGARYGDFTDHAAVCQRIKLAMIAGAAKWAPLPDIHKQALEVIADKIARILTGDPNYADNWHDIQGYAKLVEDRLPDAPSFTAQPAKDVLAEVDETARRIGAAAVSNRCHYCGRLEEALHHPDCHLLRRGKSTMPSYYEQVLAARRETATQPPMCCPECGYPKNPEGTHYVTCSKLTAPKEFVEQAEQAFDELAGTRKGCPGCGVERLTMHEGDCPLRVEPVFEGEPAAAIDDESPRSQAVGQNGNTGEHYEDPWFGAPEWAKYKAQGRDGEWILYEVCPTPAEFSWRANNTTSAPTRAILTGHGAPNPNWRDTLIQRP